MGKLKSLVMGALLGAGGMYGGLHYHLLQAEEGFLIVPRLPQQRLQDAYADVRNWDGASWTARPQLALAVTQHGRGDLISEGVATNLLDSLRDSMTPVRERLEGTSNGWEPATSTRIPAPGETRTNRDPLPLEDAQPRGNYLPLAELFGINEQTLSSIESRSRAKGDPMMMPVFPAGVTKPKPVEILPSPGEFEFLRGPNDVQLGPSAPIPGSKHSMDRRRSDATSGWQPLTVKPF